MDDARTPVEVKAGPKFSLIEFLRETRRELAKVTWPSRRDTGVITTQIVLMAIVTGLFFFAIDYVLGIIISHILGMKQ